MSILILIYHIKINTYLQTTFTNKDVLLYLYTKLYVSDRPKIKVKSQIRNLISGEDVNIVYVM